ncbi:pseudouridine synthase [Salegentibacter sp. 24]|uniref:pseudouridine synthase n=1 Tax=Salegentibacter sp. 24 TaxID=2183986 RepID=UPI0010F010F7|nr:pseudouridine synthase [Salegentibacter sp. 24]TDN87976.1 pseudouridine synthase [Salegentibacter sp. 24]
MHHRHFKIYKPYGYISQFITNERPRKKKKLLGDLGDFPIETMAVGRLDQDSEGLLFLTTNGKLSAKVNGNKIEKEYYVQVDGQITPGALDKLKQGLEISIHGETYTTLPCQAFILKEKPNFPKRAKKIRDQRHGPTSWISVTLVEGKFRQVKKMTAAIGFPTLRLVRVRIGSEKLNNMDSGEVIELSEFSY